MEKIIQAAQKTTAVGSPVHDTVTNGAMWLLAGLGISVALNQFIGGMALATAGAVIARNRDRRQGRGLLYPSVLTAWFLAVLYASIHSNDWFWPPAAGMGVVGLFSRPIMGFLFDAATAVRERTPEIVDRVIKAIFSGGGT